jgi:hypothetical protein
VPSLTCRSMPSTAVTVPKRLVRPSATIEFVMMLSVALGADSLRS